MTDVKDAPYLSILMPVFNEAENVKHSIPLLVAECQKAGCSYEILVIDDGCQDDTVGVVQELARSLPGIRIFRHARNLGPGSGIYTGIAVARGEFVIFVPADLAMEPHELQKFIAASTSADIVNGLRSDRRDYGLFRKAMSLVNISLISLMFGMRLRQYNYIQAYRRSLFERFYPESIGVFITGEILVAARDLGYRIVEVEIDYRPRMAGSTGVANWRAIRRTIEEMARFRWHYRRRRRQYLSGFDGGRYQRESVLPLITPVNAPGPDRPISS